MIKLLGIATVIGLVSIPTAYGFGVIAANQNGTMFKEDKVYETPTPDRQAEINAYLSKQPAGNEVDMEKLNEVLYYNKPDSTDEASAMASLKYFDTYINERGKYRMRNSNGVE